MGVKGFTIFTLEEQQTTIRPWLQNTELKTE